ncbi:cytochrome p450 monooxygenase [Diplodia corticola]|uniref:Cytochrome p450 monooxygenase n=1 Tax=Diplodia corticola TaxID=236234 RepID=A0A1J9R1I1_9PEZI|nr:cytochrome p450 monooxygenase [Diplodia corticola]OJD34098.1 cytochrome p450 monooxygenase [Diplodia corticola]
MATLLLALVATTSVSGVFAHQLFFRRIHVDNHPFLVLAASFGLYLALASFLQARFAQQVSAPYGVALLLMSSFVVSIWGSMLTYRAFFHPLRNFPGPFPARLSKFWAVGQVLSSGLKWYKVDAELHKKYGDYVRTGPRELSIRDPKALSAILGFTSKTLKGPFYDGMEDSVSTTRDKKLHKSRRKLWDTSMKYLLSTYTPQLEQFTDILLERIGKNVGKPVPINDLAMHYSYDVMTQLAFGEPGGFVDGSADDVATDMLDGMQKGIDAIGILCQMPWVLGILMALATVIPTPMSTFNGWAAKSLERRMKMKNPKPDLIGHLIAETAPDDKKGQHMLFTDSRVIVSAGSDTTASAISEILIMLALRPTYVSALRAEMDPVFAGTTDEYSCQKAYPVLDSLINETLRLYPPVLFGSPRVTPPGGLKIGDVFVPEDTVVYVPGWQLHHDARNFPQPDEFIPERWTTRPELIVNRSAFIPFLIGENNCPGKPLAMMEIRSVIARTLHKYDVSLPDGASVTEKGFFEGVKDHFIAGVPKQNLVFTQRVM